MASIGKLQATPDIVLARYVVTVAAYAGLSIDISDSYKDESITDFTTRLSSGKIDTFEDNEGLSLFEGTAIARHLAKLAPNSGLLGTNLKDEALVDQWVNFVRTDLGVSLRCLLFVIKGLMPPYSKPLQQFWSEPVFKALDTLDKHLSTRTFIVGERITLADILAALIVDASLTTVLDASLRPKYINVVRHYETIAHQPKIKDIFGEVEYIEKAIQYAPPAKEKKEPKPAVVVAPKAEKKPKKEEAEDDDEPAAPAEPKAKNPLDDLPKSTFNLEDWKRAYSNKDTRGPDGSLEWFYQNYDPAGFSIWRVDFKYNEELTLTFMSSNQIGGFFNRLEASRKYLFGSVGVLGENNNSVISGVLILRGPDVKGVVDVAPDWESYEYKKLEPQGNEEDKKFFEAALAWDLELDGKKWVDGKNFK